MSAASASTIRLEGPLVVGSGVAGLTVALGLPAATILSPAPQGSTGFAQGGIAVALGPGDEPCLHAEDTRAAAAGLAVGAAVDVLVEEGPAAVRRLIELGARFDTDPTGGLALGREAGHHRRRIVHANGDATGREVLRTLLEAVAARPSLDLWEGWRAVDLLRVGDRVTGAVAIGTDGGRVRVLAPEVILATGGFGRLYRRTTNPSGVTGDGIAMARRAGARLADLEFVQFHPTALLVEGVDPMPLLTEALRGEGATLVDGQGRRFMTRHHPDAELAPRDVVARAIWWQHDRGEGAFLDSTRIAGLPERFPTVFAAASAAGLDPRRHLLPVSPAAHYAMGGVDVDRRGRTSLPGLWAVGEVASTGVHGANRLASNSLLEGLVFGSRLAADVREGEHAPPDGGQAPPEAWELPAGDQGVVEEVRSLMWERVGLVRTGEGLGKARSLLLDMEGELRQTLAGRVAADLAREVIAAALRRTESRGSHYRADHPERDPVQAHRLLVQPVAAEVV